MSLFSKLNLELRRRTHPVVPAGAVLLEPPSASGLNDLSERLSRWGQLWSAGKENPDTSAQELITERLTHLMRLCFGERMPTSLHGNGDPVSLSSSMPILTAFLGRRATRELSRRVLQDI
jgi:hypothetical protein